MKLKKYYISFVLFLIGFVVFAQTPNNTLENPSNTVQMDFKRINTRKNAKALVLEKESGSSEKLRPTDCIIDPSTGRCIDIIIPPVGGSTSSSYVGSIPDEFNVSLSGAATYSIPINLPPGIKDLEPNINITFSSQASNGLVGWGWNISGLSTITRVPATKFHDGYIDGVDFDIKDRFALDGQRLLLKNGSYGASNSEYQTESYSNIKIKAYGTSPYGASYGPSYFVVFYPNGTRAYYGNGGYSRGRLEWALYRRQDPQGNYIEYNYSQSNGLLRINRIKYGSRLGTTPPNDIYFFYKTRTRPELSYFNGFSFKRTHILDRIEVKGKGQLYRKYMLTHSTTALGYQRLSSVREYNGANKYFPSIYFTYEYSSSGVSRDGNTLDIYPGINYNSDKIEVGEFDGDGKMDFITYNKYARNKLNIFTDIFGSYGSGISIGYSVNMEKFDDVFANTILSWNGKVLSQQGITTVRETVNSSNATARFRTFAMAAYGPVFQYDKTVNFPIGPVGYFQCDQPTNDDYRKIPKAYISGDFNGDGLTDVLAIPKKYYKKRCEEYEDPWDGYPECECYDSNVSQGNSEVYFIDLKRTATTSAVNIGSLAYRIQDSKDKLFAIDFNGDGKTDLMHIRDGLVRVYSLSSSNQLIQIAYLSNTYIDKDKPILLGDYNGDGKTDFTIPSANNSTTWRFYVSKGNSIYYYSKNIGVKYQENYVHNGWKYVNGVNMHNPLYEYHFIAQDYNGDGKSDILKHEVVSPYSSYNVVSDRLQLYTNKHSSSESTPSFVLTTNSLATNNGLTKFGIPMFLEAKSTNSNLEYAYIDGNNVHTYVFNRDHKKEMSLKKISNNGVVTNIFYERLDSRYGTNTYSFDYNEVYPYANVNVAPPLKIVKEVKRTASGHTQRKLFQYKGAVHHSGGLGFLGFKVVKRTNWFGAGVGQLWNISKHDMQKRGAVSQQWTSQSSSDPPYSFVDKTSYTYTTQLLSNKVFVNVPTQIVREDGLQGITSTENYSYDAYKNPLAIDISFAGGSRSIHYQYSNNSAATSQYYHIGRPTKKTEVRVVNGNSFSTEIRFTNSNNLVLQTKKKGNGTPWLTESFQYDNFGNITRKVTSGTGISNRIESFEYDTSGRFRTKSTDILGLSTTNTYNLATGNLLTSTTSYGQTTTFSYDGWQRLLKEKNYLGKETNYAYNKENLSGIGWCTTKTIDYPEGQDEKTYYNAFGWVVQTRKLSLNGKWIQKSFEYDDSGRQIRESEPYFSNASPTQWNRVSFDQYGRPIVHTSFTGRVINTTYNGLSVTVDDGNKTVTTTKDALGNIVTMQDPGGTINYQYFGNNVMKSAKYSNHTVSVTIDGWGRKTSLSDPSTGTYTFEYNILGQPTKETGPKGVTQYFYDNYGRILRKEINGEHTALSSVYAYNAATKLLTSITGLNQRAGVNSTYNYNYYYDSNKRLNKVKETTGLGSFEKRMTYDGFGRVNSENYISYHFASQTNSNVKVKNSYDAAGILKEIRDFNSNNLLWEITDENARGQDLSITLGNGIIKTKQYDQYGFVTNITDKENATNGVQALKMTYNFDVQRGLLNYRKNYAFTNWSENFNYDNLDRLTQITGATSRSQNYDNRGRITNNSLVGNYNYSNSNRYRLANVNLNNQGDIYYQQHNLQQVTYNVFKNPVEIFEEGKGRVSFEYGPMKNRTQAYYGGLQEEKLQRKYHKQYSSITPVEMVHNKVDNTIKIITYIGGDAYTAPIAFIKIYGGPLGNNVNEYHYLHRDYLGSILAITNSNTEILEQRQFGAWGETHQFIDNFGNKTFSHGALIGRGYTGHEHFFEVSLIHMNGRMYDAHLGRFLSPDNYIQAPYNTQSFNRYGYVLNNPLVSIDPSGDFWFVLIGAIVGAYIGASVHQGSFNPAKWGSDWWKGALVGAVVGAYGAQLLAGGATSGMLAGGGISKGTLFSKTLIGAGKAMVKKYISGIFSFSLDSGFKFDFSLDKGKMNKMLLSGALGAIGGLLGEGKDLIYKAGKNGAKATGLLANKEWVGKLTRNLLDNTLGGISSNIVNGGKGVFEDLTYFKFGGGLIELGEGKKVFNLSKIGDHAIGWALYGLSSGMDGIKMPKFDIYSLNFNYKPNSKFWNNRIKNWWKNKPLNEKFILGGYAVGMAGIVSTLGVKIEF